jgi:site-specific DNA recombinase
MGRPRCSTTPTTKRAIVYVRVSDPKQERDGTSLETQEAACRRYAADHGYAVVVVHSDVHSGADLFERPGLSAVRAAIRARDADVLVCHALDRLSRDQDHRGLIFSEADYAGVAVEFVTEKLEDTPEGRLLLTVRSFQSEVERLKITERTQRGERARAASGKLLPGPRPLYGYRWRDADKSALDLDPDTSAVVRRIVDELLQGKPLCSVAASLDADGIPTPSGGRQWAISVLSSMLKNPAYCGQPAGLQWRTERERGCGPRQVRRPVDEHVRFPNGTVPPIMTPAEFGAIGSRLRKNQEQSARNNRNPEATLLRGGILRCGVCGSAMNAERRRDRDGRPWYRYRCSNHVGAPKPTMAADNLDAAVWEGIGRVLGDESVIAAKVRRLQRDGKSDHRTADLERRLEKVQARPQRLAKAVALVDDDEAAAPLLDELKALGAEAQRLAAERDNAANQDAASRITVARMVGLQEWCRRVAANLPSLDHGERRQLLDQLGVEVTLWPTDAPRRWEAVMRPNPADPRGGIAFGTAAGC